jgi:hypothetical protein
LCDSAQPRFSLQRPHELDAGGNTGALVAFPLSGGKPFAGLLGEAHGRQWGRWQAL